MAVKTILTEPNKLLRQVSKPVERVTKEEQNLMDDMLDTMYAANGIGLAAIQIGVPKRIIVMDLSKNPEKKEPRYFVNPIIKNKDHVKNMSHLSERGDLNFHTGSKVLHLNSDDSLEEIKFNIEYFINKFK